MPGLPKEVRRILIIIRRANGDVLLSSPVINALKVQYPEALIDLVVNETTVSMAESLPHISKIYAYCYSWRKKGLFYRLFKEAQLFFRLWKKYDLAISLTASDRDVFLAVTSGRYSIAQVEEGLKKSWWKKAFLDQQYYLENDRHIVLNNLKALAALGISPQSIEVKCKVDPVRREVMRRRLENLGINRFVVFHPSAKGVYKIYPSALRHQLLNLLSQAGVAVVVTGGATPVDKEISAKLPSLPNLHNFIGQCDSIAELIALMDLSAGYIGMDTLNMHLAASLGLPIFAIFGPTNPCVWSPWSNALQQGGDMGPERIQVYGNVYLFQAVLPCVPCFKAGCGDQGIKSECLDHISPEFIVRVFLEFWTKNSQKNTAP